MRTREMRIASYLLPDPGGEVVRECLDEIELLRKTFKHYHKNNGVDDTCEECGLDLRNPIHFM